MNIDKAELKMQLAQSSAKTIEQTEEAVKRDMFRLEGGLESLRQCAKALDGHRAYYQTAVDEGQLDAEECSLAMEVITRCVGGIQNLVDRATVALRLKQGELKGVQSALGVLEKTFMSEKRKVEAVLAAIEDGEEYDSRPKVSAADDINRRREEARAAKTAAPDSYDATDEAEQLSKMVAQKASKKVSKKKASKKKKGSKKGVAT